MAERAERPRAGPSAKALLLTILGEFVLPHGGTVWTKTLVDALSTQDIEERNGRQAIARLADQDLMESHRIGRRTQWHLTARGRQLLTDGTERIYQFSPHLDAWDGRWILILCSVPEDQRAKRHKLRSQLSFAGFGFLGAGVAICPHLDREPLAKAVLQELDLLPTAMLFKVDDTGDDASTQDLLARAWDLDEVGDRYRAFVSAFDHRRPGTDEAEFAALTELVHAWRWFPFIDPEIPDRLLPGSWPGRAAKALFDDRHALWSPGANRHFKELDSAS